MMEFKVFENHEGEVEVVKQGWSWIAFFFSYIWLIIKLFGRLGIILFSGLFIIGLIGIALGGNIIKIGDILSGIGNIIFMILLGINGKKIYEINLLSKDFEFKKKVIEKSPNRAIALYLRERKSG